MNEFMTVGVLAVAVYALLYAVAVAQVLNVGQVPMPWHIRRVLWDGLAALARTVRQEAPLRSSSNLLEWLPMDTSLAWPEELTEAAEKYYREKLLPQGWCFSPSQQLMFQALLARAHGELALRDVGCPAEMFEGMGARAPWRRTLGVPAQVNDSDSILQAYKAASSKSYQAYQAEEAIDGPQSKAVLKHRKRMNAIHAAYAQVLTLLKQQDPMLINSR